MAVPDPGAGQAFVYLVTFFLLLSIAVGGGCLIAYTILPYPPSWLSYVGITFVCLPWLFWLLTFVYRLLSRALGFRMVVGSGGNADADTVTREIEPPGRNPESQHEETPAKVQSGQALMSNGGQEGNRSKKRTSTSSNSSLASHESEMPLAISMGT
ncbi:PREDICTED: uncharacterized protein LOC104804402 [Tarenaya hassleriana]|uniref:uncharacterized protein LOC104804402 n=1 Tax=Tarenaya hassleriana TaxID=28532 RepID=UPI00053C3279|nr:PREDICTED: uncharacterized protein LOC104804402 [Tarenaya hassleriana]